MESKRVHDLAQPRHPADSASKIYRPTEMINLVDSLTKLVEGPEDPAAEARSHAVESFLREYVFRGLNDLKPPYDSPLVAHFRAVDFLRVIARCNLLGIHINGVEIFNPRGQLVEVVIGERDSNDWCVSLVLKYYRGKRSFCATYSVPDSVLGMPPELLDLVDQAEHLGRPYVTACIDCYTRCILGIYIGFTPPSYQSVAACLKHCFMPKVNLKQDYPEIVNDWSAYGVMDQLVVDGGREFYSVSLDRACHLFNIDWVASPRRAPWFKPYIERFMKTMNDNVAHGIPGTTFSNIFEKGDYDPVKHAVIPFSELKQNIYKWIVDVYHQTPHRSTGTSPAKMWDSTVKSEAIRMPDELTRLDVALGRVYEGRRLSHKGVEFEGLLYNSPDLKELRMREGANLVVDIRVDESNLGFINVTHPRTVSEYSVPAINFEYANGVSLWLHKVLKNCQRKKDQPNQTAEGWLEAKAEIQRKIIEASMNKRLKPSKRRGRLDEALSDADQTACKRRLAMDSEKDSEEVIQAEYHIDLQTEGTAYLDQSTFQDSEYPVFQAIRRKEVSYE